MLYSKKELKLGVKCNNNCVFCEDLGFKADYEKSFEDIKKELNILKEKGYSHLVLPCNSDIRKDFFEILKYAKDLNFIISLKTNGRMFYYKYFCNKIKGLVDNFQLVLSSNKENMNNLITGTENTLFQTFEGLENIKKITKNLTFFIPLTRTNSKNLHEILSLKNSDDFVFKITNPHPEIYDNLRKMNKNLKVIDLPYEVKVELTPKCNLKCDFCFNTNTFSRNSKELPTKEFFKIIDRISESGIKRVRFTGGEPLLRRDLLIILEYAKSKDLHITVNTNSTLLNSKNIQDFKGIVDRFLFPFHSLDKDDISRKFELIKIIEKNNIHPVLNTVLTKENIDSLEKFFEIVKSVKIDWFLARPVPTLNNKETMLNSDVEDLIEKLIILKERFGSITIDSIPFCAYNPEKVRLFSVGAQSCGIFNKLVIDPGGNIKPCYSINEFVGNYKEDILNIWQNEFLINFRQLKMLPNQCKKCKYVYECIGGCRFAAKLVNGNYSDLDPLAQPDKYKEFLFE